MLVSLELIELIAKLKQGDISNEKVTRAEVKQLIDHYEKLKVTGSKAESYLSIVNYQVDSLLDDESRVEAADRVLLAQATGIKKIPHAHDSISQILAYNHIANNEIGLLDPHKSSWVVGSLFVCEEVDFESLYELYEDSAIFNNGVWILLSPAFRKFFGDDAIIEVLTVIAETHEYFCCYADHIPEEFKNKSPALKTKIFDHQLSM